MFSASWFVDFVLACVFIMIRIKCSHPVNVSKLCNGGDNDCSARNSVHINITKDIEHGMHHHELRYYNVYIQKADAYITLKVTI